MPLDIKVVKGMKDILPDEMAYWYYVEKNVKQLASSYGYQEIRMPVLEQVELFKRSIGEVTDIVEKEMYTFTDKGGDTLTLRPESTAQTVRAVLENNLVRNQTQKLWYYGPMFRRENPQKGRYRQFYQFGIEAFGLEGPDIDAEQMIMMARLWQNLGLKDRINLQINSIGTLEERNRYRQALVAYFEQCDGLDEDSQRRLNSNPLRILDSKNPTMQAIIQQAPSILDYLGEESSAHFAGVKALLTANQIPFEVNPRLVRGLDYYTHTVYEWVTSALGSQGTVCAGGRYNDLVKQLGGAPLPSCGFAMGIERLVLLLQETDQVPQPRNVDVYFVVENETTKAKAFVIAEKMRDHFPGIKILVHAGTGSFKSQFKRADKCGAMLALILGEQELAQNTISIKNLRVHSDQESKTFDQTIEYLREQLK